VDPPHPDPELEFVEFERALASRDPGRRAAALLHAPERPGAEELIIRVLMADPAVDVRRAAARSLARFRGAGATRALIAASSLDLSPAVRAEAVAAVGRLLRQLGREPSGSP
jgi:hypothetical protein